MEFYYYDMLPKKVKEIVSLAPYDFSCKEIYNEYVDFRSYNLFLSDRDIEAGFAKELLRNMHKIAVDHAAVSPPVKNLLLNTRRQLDRTTRMCYGRRSQPTRRRQA